MWVNKKYYSKAHILSYLRDKLKAATVLDSYILTVKQWKHDPRALISEIKDHLKDETLIVRSSSLDEDGISTSLAGKYISILNVEGEENLSIAIESVISSFGESAALENEIFIQPMLLNTSMSGVVFTREPSTGSNYWVINYTESDDTSLVTSGAGCPNVFYYFRDGGSIVPRHLSPVIEMLRELEIFFPNTPLDIEFAIDKHQKIYLLQVRNLYINGDMSGDLLSHKNILDRVYKKIKAAQSPHPFLYGDSTIFGVMPDWNPAEIIGVRPRPLALSLYRNLVTDSTWAYQRNNYGYRNLRSFPLIQSFAGQPFIDVRVSFNSFIPKDLDSSLSNLLINFYIDKLAKNPALHDKVEFEIVYSCYTFDLEERLTVLGDFGFTPTHRKELKESLRNLTKKIIDRKTGLWREDAAKIEILKARREEILKSALDPISKIYWLMEDCRRYGTLPFAGLARVGFIAIQILKSLVSVGIFTTEDYELFMGSLNTVSTQFSNDLSSLDRTTFLSLYGHLRPGTYDINSPRYDEDPIGYLGARSNGSSHHTRVNKKFLLSVPQMRAIEDLLVAHGLEADVLGFLDFLKSGIEMREQSKFVFTKNLSDALSLFTEWGHSHGFSADDLSFAHIDCIAEIYSGADNDVEIISNSINTGKRKFLDTCQVCLPSLITKPDDAYAFVLPNSDPNFITLMTATGHVALPEQREKLQGGIIFISNADPGFDWLFSHDISGLVTAYGGVNSHMAIRANELGIPAVIGAGEPLFNMWKGYKRMLIDCPGKRVCELS